jgi:predicted metal-dependent HD superfamily phosphohydrolase
MISIGNPVGSKAILEKLLECYGESHRHYHTLSHIVSMLDEFDTVSVCAQNPNTIKFAIWYHDVVYDVTHDPLQKSSEERSADTASEDLTALGFDFAQVEKVSRLIRLTTHQSVEGLSFDERLFLDLDLAILGSNPPLFREYEENSRQEYSWVSDEVYRRERIKILVRLLKREPLYLTGHFQGKYERIAKSNLAESIQKLSV